MSLVEWVAGPRSKMTVKRETFRNKGKALACGRKHADNGRKVTYSTEFLAVVLQGPVQTVMGIRNLQPRGRKAKLYVVTTRPKTAFEKSQAETKV